jgi:SAM-dependent methyltransferase
MRRSDTGRASDAKKYWEDESQHAFRSNSHWKGEAGIKEDIWLQIGAPHRKLLEDHARLRNRPLPFGRIIEWGCGGGANAVHFAPLAETFVGVDISKASLEECEAVLRGLDGKSTFVAVLADAMEPEKSVDALIGTCDVFLCTYVFELLPSQDYGQRILDIAHRVLLPGGFAIIQIKYETNDSATRSHNWDYRRNLANMTTYAIDAFWQRAQQAKFVPFSVSLRPRDTLINDERYAYFILDRP